MRLARERLFPATGIPLRQHSCTCDGSDSRETEVTGGGADRLGPLSFRPRFGKGAPFGLVVVIADDAVGLGPEARDLARDAVGVVEVLEVPEAVAVEAEGRAAP